MKTGAASSLQEAPRQTVVIVFLMAAHLSLSSLVADPAPDFDKTSLTLRTALHYDPSVQSPLQKLVELYSAAGRTEELVALYAAHLAQYPQDANAKLVLSRLYMALQDRRAEGFLKSSVAQHPDHALLVWQQALYLESQHDARAVEEMARAVSLEKSAARRGQWFGELMKAVSVQGREDLLLAQTKQLIDEAALNAEQRLRWARQALPLKLIKTAGAMLQQLNLEALSTDGSVEVSMLQAEIMNANGETKEAGLALDALLGRLASDYWRRREILMLRLDLSNSAERETLVGQARSRWKEASGKTETNALTFADVLEAAHRSHESLAMLREAAQLLPESRAIESHLLDAWDRDGVTEEALIWIAEKARQTPDRDDLALRQVRWLFAMNQSSRALAEFTRLMGKLTENQQVERSMELARWLRRRNQLTESSNVLEAVLHRASNRWDLRRELAELYLAQQRRDDAARLFIGDWSRDLATDVRLEIAQFMLGKQWWAEAKALLAPWLARQTNAFDAILLMARIHEKLGEDESVELMLDKARVLCDTDMRYQAWLTTAWDYAESRELQERWLDAEAVRLTAAEVNDANRQSNFNHWVALIELAQSHQEDKIAETLLNQVMAMAGLPDDKKRVIEKLKLDLLSADVTRATETEAGLRKLLQQDAEHAEDYRMRLILFYHKMQRPDLATELMNKLNAAKCTEAALLRAVITLFQTQGSLSPALACAERLTQLEPGERANWSQWMSLLVQEGKEEQLRYALRQVMSKTHDWNLKPEVLEDLRTHLLTSHWRGILRELNGGEDDWAAARRAAAELESLDLTQEQRRWTNWLLAFLSGKLGDVQAVQDALNKFKKLDEKQWIPFPDGMELSVAQGRLWLERLLKKQETSPVHSLHKGPLAPFTMQWGFVLDENVIINKVLLSTDSRMVYLCDDRQQIYALNCKTGKLRWKLNTAGSSDGEALKKARLTLPASLTRMSGARPYYNNGQPEMKLPVSLAESDNHLCYMSGDQVVCVQGDTGEVVWKNKLGDAPSDLPVALTPQSKVVISHGHVVVWQPGVSIVSALHLMSGKLSWQTMIPAPPAPALNLNNGWGGYDPYSALKTSLSIQDGVVFVAHKNAALLRIDDGTVLWRLSTENTPEFPIELHTRDEESPIGISTNVPYQTVIISGSMNPMGQMRNMRGMNNQRWTYGNGISAALQGYYAGYALMHGDQIWAFGGTGAVEVSLMGLPLSQSSFNGTIAGFAGDSLIGINGQGVEAISLGKGSMVKSLLTKSRKDETTNVIDEDHASVAVSDTRVYEYAGSQLRAADVRNGTVLFDVSLPEEVKAWKKTFVKEAAPMSIPGYAMRQQNNNRRSYLPSGILMQDNQGGGVLFDATSVVTRDLWIFPVSDHGIVCLAGIAPEASPPNATNP